MIRGEPVHATDHDAFATAALAHDLAGFACRALDEGRWAPPAGVAERVRTAHAERSLHTALLRLELAACAPALAAAAGAAPIVLKGPAVAARHYREDPELRPHLDLDVLVPRDRLRAAAQGLCAARGFAPARGERFFAAAGEPWPGFAERFGHELVVSRRAAGHTLTIELHWRVGDDAVGARLDHAALTPGAVPLDGLPAGAVAPGAVDELLVLCVHLMHHVAPTVLWCLDVARAADALDEREWREAFARARALGMSWVLHAGLDRSASVLGGGGRPRPEPRPRRASLPALLAGRTLPVGVGVHARRLATMPWRSRATYVGRAAQASWLRAAARTRRTNRSA